MKNILFVGPFPPYQKGGGENAAYSLAKAVKSRKNNVFVLSMGKDKFFEKYEDDGIKYYRIDKFYENRRYNFSLFQIFRYFTIEVFNPFMFLFTIYLILKYKIDIVHQSTFHQISSSPLIAAKLLFRKTVITFHSHELFCFLSSLDNECKKVRKGNCGYCVFNAHKIPKELRYKIIYKISISLANNIIKSILFFNLKVANLANYIIFPSNYLKNFYLNYGLKENGTKVIYNFLNDLKSNKRDAKKFKRSYGIKNEKIIFFAGNMIKVKGPEVLLEAFKLLKDKKNLKLIFVGTGPFLDELKRRASELRLDKYIIFTGWVSRSRLNSIYSISHIVVIPSLFPETFSLVFLEAFNARKIVIASDIGALTENISNGNNGFLVRPNDSKALAAKLKYVIENLKKLEYMRTRASNDAILKYNVKNILKEYEEIYS